MGIVYVGVEGGACPMRGNNMNVWLRLEDRRHLNGQGEAGHQLAVDPGSTGWLAGSPISLVLVNNPDCLVPRRSTAIPVAR